MWTMFDYFYVDLPIGLETDLDFLVLELASLCRSLKSFSNLNFVDYTNKKTYTVLIFHFAYKSFNIVFPLTVMLYYSLSNLLFYL